MKFRSFIGIALVLGVGVLSPALALAQGAVDVSKAKLKTPAAFTEKAPDTYKAKFETSKGKVVKKVVLKNRKVNTLLKYRFRCTFKKGTYRFYVYGTDAAGNRQSKVASNRLHVR